jgi:hypothetical protein
MKVKCLAFVFLCTLFSCVETYNPFDGVTHYSETSTYSPSGIFEDLYTVPIDILPVTRGTGLRKKESNNPDKGYTEVTFDDAFGSVLGIGAKTIPTSQNKAEALKEYAQSHNKIFEKESLCSLHWEDSFYYENTSMILLSSRCAESSEILAKAQNMPEKRPDMAMGILLFVKGDFIFQIMAVELDSLQDASELRNKKVKESLINKLVKVYDGVRFGNTLRKA